MAPRPDAKLTKEERARFEAIIAHQILQRFRWGIAPGVMLILLLGVVTTSQLVPDRATARLLWPAFVIPALLLALALPLSWLPVFQRLPNLLNATASSATAMGIGWIAAHTGGFRSPILATLMLIWIYGVVIMPLSPLSYALQFSAHLVWATTAVLVFCPDPGSPLFIAAVTTGGCGFCLLGAVLRQRADLQSFINQGRLDEANRGLEENRGALARLNEELESRVDAQVHEIVARSRENEALNVQLQAKVQERSRELALALDRLASRDRGSEPLSRGHRIGARVEVIRPLGIGGMGAVYLGTDLLTSQTVAVKLMHVGIASDRESLRRFVAEATAASAVRDPGVVRTLHIDVTDDGRLFQLMEFVDGVTLERRLQQGALEPGHAARLGAAIAGAISAAHSAGIVHRDIKPANVMLCADRPGIRVLDFGLSKLLLARSPDAPAMTQANQTMGTPAYMSPEQIRDAASVGPATDVYSIGVVLFEMFAGELPFAGNTSTEILFKHLGEAPPELRGRGGAIPARVSALVQRCLQKELDGRPAAAEVFAELTAAADELRAPPAEVIHRGELDSAARGRQAAGAMEEGALGSAPTVLPTAHAAPTLLASGKAE